MDDIVFTPEEVAKLLKLSKGTVYDLIKKGEIIAKRYGNVFRISRKSLSFVFDGLDADIITAETQDRMHISAVQAAIDSVRGKLSKKRHKTPE